MKTLDHAQVEEIVKTGQVHSAAAQAAKRNDFRRARRHAPAGTPPKALPPKLPRLGNAPRRPRLLRAGYFSIYDIRFTRWPLMGGMMRKS